MKCNNCGDEMRYIFGSNYICDKCGFVANNHSGFSIDYTKQDSTSVPKVGDGITSFPNISDQVFIRQGWQCPRCGTILSPDMSWCPFCSGPHRSTVVFGGSPSGTFINPNITATVSDSNTTKESGDK